MNRHTPPTIADLTARFLSRTDDAESLAAAAAALGEVEPHNVSVGFRVEPRTAWSESVEVMTAFGFSADIPGTPADWGGLVVRAEPTAALPFALGNFPQRVRDLSALTTAASPAKLLPAEPTAASASSALIKWATKHLESGAQPQALIAAGAYRLAGDFSRAESALDALAPRIAPEWKPLFDNERAALMWACGRYAEARAIWSALPDSIPVRFNRGMAALFLGDSATARTELKAVTEMLPEESPWHHLAGLYALLAESA